MRSSHTSLSSVLAVVVWLAGCDSFEDPFGARYEPCVTDEDCDRAAPLSMTFQLAGGVARWCTNECNGGTDCKVASDDTGLLPGCSGVDELGNITPGQGRPLCVLRCRLTMPTNYCPAHGLECFEIAGGGDFV